MTPEELKAAGEALVAEGNAKIAEAKRAQRDAVRIEGEAAQEAHEAALASFNTQKKDGMRQSHCGHPLSPEEAEKLD